MRTLIVSIATSTSCSAGGWSAVSRVDGADGHGKLSNWIAINAGGDAAAAWSVNHEGNFSVWVNRAPRGSEWGPTVQLGPPSDSVPTVDAYTRIGLDEAGNAIAIWSLAPHVGTPARMWSSRFDRMSGWSTPIAISPESDHGDPIEPELIVDPNGDALATWHMLGSSVWSARYVANKGWDPATMHALGGRPAIASDGAGNYMVVWMQSEKSISFAKYTRGKGWSEPTPVIGLAALRSAQVVDIFTIRIVMDSAGRALLFWYENDDDYRYRSYMRYAPDVGWSRVGMFADDAGFSPLPSPLIGSAGVATGMVVGRIEDAP